MSAWKHSQIGFTLIEVLITVVVIAIGLLGIAGLRAVSLNNGHVSYLRSVASIHSENMAEMMRANIGGVNGNFYRQGTDAGSINYAAIDPATPPANNCRTAICTPAEQAQADAYFWISAIRRDLPVGAAQVAGAVTCNDRVTTDANTCTAGSTHTITVSWQEKVPKNPGPPAPKSFRTVFRP